MEARRRTWFDERGLAIAGAEGARHLPFYAGGMHHTRVPPDRWAACLRALHAQGLTIVDTCVPWRLHEPTRGTYVWRGPNDLPAFLDAARAAGLAVALRVGPSAGAETTSFGFPDHVLDDPACLARTARGTPAWMPAPPRAWPLPSYASAAFHARVAAWYAEVARVVGPHLAPDGPIVALGVDHQAHLFLRRGAYDLDYHPDAVTWWQEATGLEGEPPTAWDPDQAARCISWVRFKDRYLARALGLFGKALDQVGLGGVARFHALPPVDDGVVDLPVLQHALGGPVGIGAWAPRAELRELRRRTHALVGRARPLPLVFASVGGSAWLPPVELGAAGDGDPQARERDQLLHALAAGARGFALEVLVERDRHHGAAIDTAGRLDPKAAWIGKLVTALAEIDWPSLVRPARIALVATSADARFGHATAALDPLTPVLAELLQLGPGGAAELGTDPGAVAARRWHAAITSALELAQVPYAVVDEAATEDELARYRAVIAPTTERIDRGLWQRLRALADHKRAIVVIGPSAPTLDELGQPLSDPAPRRAGKIRDGSLDDLPGLAEDLAALAGELPDAWQIERPETCRAYAYADADGVVKVVFIVNDGDRPATAVLLADEPTTTLRDPFTREELRAVEGRIAVQVPAHGVRIATRGGQGPRSGASSAPTSTIP